MPQTLFRLLPLLLCLALLPGCAQRTTVPRAPSPASATLEDLRVFPQDLTVYARAAGADKAILSREEQRAQAARFIGRYFGAWDMDRASIRKKEVAAAFRKARGYKDGSTRWTQPEWDALRANAALEHYPSAAQPAITIRNTDLRELPTRERRFSEPTPDPHANPFDYFQYSLLPVGTPLLIAHTSRDGRWHYVECAVAGGWVAAQDVAPVGESLRAAYRNGPFVTPLRDKVPLGDTGATADIGAILPSDGADTLAPVRGPDGMAALRPVRLAANQAAAWPLPMTPRRVAGLGNVMRGQPYGWGGMFGDRDCSGLTRDILAPFGIWLPRNSVAQARVGVVHPLTGDARAKEARILQNGVPFLSLVGMRGHIMLYVGRHKNRPAIFHNVWGVRVIEDGNDNARHVIGKAVVTSVTPGAELPNLYRPVSFVDRLRTLSTPADALP